MLRASPKIFYGEVTVRLTETGTHAMTPWLKRIIEKTVTIAVGTVIGGVALGVIGYAANFVFKGDLARLLGGGPIKWVDAKGGFVPKTAIEVGKDREGRTLYVCRVRDGKVTYGDVRDGDDAIHPGKIAKLHPGMAAKSEGNPIKGYDHCAYVFGKEFKESKNYEVLTQ